MSHRYLPYHDSNENNRGISLALAKNDVFFTNFFFFESAEKEP